MIDLTATAGAILRDGGATISLDGTVPTTGFAVALPGHEYIVPLSAFGPDVLRAYLSDHAVALSAPDHYLGAWVDGDEVYLDVTAIYVDRELAMTSARASDQLAIYDLTTQNTEAIQ